MDLEQLRLFWKAVLNMNTEWLEFLTEHNCENIDRLIVGKKTRGAGGSYTYTPEDALRHFKQWEWI
jgi:hypothetical protein